MSLRAIASRVLKGDPLRRPRLCYGQNGEDLVLDRLVDGQREGFFVDVGAHHPVRFSNTYLFYRRGWRGINIDAEPGSMAPFAKLRPRDVNVEAGVASAPGSMTYFRFDEPALNTFNPDEAALKDGGAFHVIEKVQVKMLRLDAILAQYLPTGQRIDFMSIDVEGQEIDVFESNDWDRFRPRFLAAETLRTSLLDLGDNEIVKWLVKTGYRPITQAYNTTFFEDIRA